MKTKDLINNITEQTDELVNEVDFDDFGPIAQAGEFQLWLEVLGTKNLGKRVEAAKELFHAKPSEATLANLALNLENFGYAVLNTARQKPRKRQENILLARQTFNEAIMAYEKVHEFNPDRKGTASAMRTLDAIARLAPEIAAASAIRIGFRHNNGSKNAYNFVELYDKVSILARNGTNLEAEVTDLEGNTESHPIGAYDRGTTLFFPWHIKESLERGGVETDVDTNKYRFTHVDGAQFQWKVDIDTPIYHAAKGMLQAVARIKEITPKVMIALGHHMAAAYNDSAEFFHPFYAQFAGMSGDDRKNIEPIYEQGLKHTRETIAEHFGNFLREQTQ